LNSGIRSFNRGKGSKGGINAGRRDGRPALRQARFDWEGELPKVQLIAVAMALACILLAGGFFQATTAQAACGGDCSGDGEVSPAELNRIVSIINLCGGVAAGCPAVPGADKQCTSADADEDGTISAGELTRVIDEDVLAENPDCAATGLGTRLFTIANTTSATDPPTGFFSTGSIPIVNQVGEVTLAPSATMCPPQCGWYVDQPIKIRAGAPDPVTGIAPVRLEEDVVYGYRIIDNSTTVCVKLLAAGSTGQLDCDGGSPQDVILNADSNFSGNATSSYDAYIGNVSRAGALTLDVMGTVDNTSTLASANDCATWVFADEPNRMVFTTETVTVRITEVPNTGNPARYCSLNETRACSNTNACPAGMGTCSIIRLTRLGSTPFNCANWTQSDSGARLQTGLFGEATQVGDTANLQRLTD
jgi:hypothetical protein